MGTSTTTTRRYALPWTASGPFVVVAPVAGILLGHFAFWMWLVLGILDAFRRRWSVTLELTPTEALARRILTVEVVPWIAVTSVRRGGWSSGGVLFETTSGPVKSWVPCSWWGGPANPEQLAEIERWWLEHRRAGGEPAI